MESFDNIPSIKHAAHHTSNPHLTLVKQDDSEEVASPFRIHGTNPKPKPLKKGINITTDTIEEAGLEAEALEKLLEQDSLMNSFILFEMFGYKELNSYINQELLKVESKSKRYFQLQFLWIDWLLQDQRYVLATEILNKILEEIDTQADTGAHSRILVGLGKAYTGLWKLNDATEKLEKVIDIERQLQWTQSDCYLEANRWMGIIRHYQARYNEASEYFSKCLNLGSRTLPVGHPWLVATSLDLGYVYEHQWQLNEALRLAKEALLHQKNYFKTTNYQMARSYELLGSVYFKQGDTPEAMRAFEKTLGVLMEYRGKKHSDAIHISLKIAHLQLITAHVDKATGIITKCIKVLESNDVNDSPLLSKAYFLLGVAFFYTRKFYDSITNYMKSWTINIRIFGIRHPYVANDYELIGRALSTQGRLQEAYAMLQKSLEIKTQVFGENSFETANIYQSLGLNYMFQGDFRSSMQSYKKCLRLQERCLVRDHYSLAMPYMGIGRVYAKWGQTEQALLNYKKSLSLWKSAFGNCHPKVASNYADIGNCYLEKEMFGKAHEYFVKALLAGYSSPVRHPSFEQKTMSKHRDSKIYLELLTSIGS